MDPEQITLDEDYDDGSTDGGYGEYDFMQQDQDALSVSTTPLGEDSADVWHLIRSSFGFYHHHSIVSSSIHITLVWVFFLLASTQHIQQYGVAHFFRIDRTAQICCWI